MKKSASILSGLVFQCLATGHVGYALDLVRDGTGITPIVIVDPATGGKARGTDEDAARVLADWIRKITDVELPVVSVAPTSGPAIYVGAAALKAGLKLDDIDSLSSEGLRVHCDGTNVLLAGQCASATTKAVCRFLEELGCRYFMDMPLGEVYPRTRTLSVGELAITEKPKLLMRRTWGSSWGEGALWKTWNGNGGQTFRAAHAWSGYVSSREFTKHPEWFAVQRGQRYNSGWLCTSNPDLRRFFADRVIAAVKAGDINPSLSPPDGRGHCQCEACTALDDPNSLEVGGVVSKSNRYVEFYRAIATEVAKVYPKSVLTFYAYADYTLPPTSGKPLPPNLCAFIAPIGYCWLHGLENDHCTSRQQVKKIYDGWARYVSKFGYRGYDYNFGDCILPFCKLSVWQKDMPYFRNIGCVGIDMETLPCWMIYGPHMYLFLRLAYDPDADAKALIDDYFLKFYGQAAGPLVRQYFLDIDKAGADLPCDPEKGGRGLDVLAAIYTPGFLVHLRDLIDRAASAAKDDETYAARVAMTGAGLKNAEEYRQLLDAMNQQRYREALVLHDGILARNTELLRAKLTNHYSLDYFRRFVTGGKDLARLAAISPPHKVIEELPDLWRSEWDKDGSGLEKGYEKTGFDDSAWGTVSTYKVKMTSSGDLASTRDWKYRWFRVRFTVPEDHGRIALFFSALQPNAMVYINGKLANGPNDRPRSEWNSTFLADVSSTVQPGENLLAIRRPHAWGSLADKAVVVIDQGK
jgi:hypothetical protein